MIRRGAQTDMERAAPARKWKWLWTPARAVIGLGLIIFLLARCDLKKILGFVGGMDIRYLAGGLGLYLVFIVVSAWRWHLLLEHKRAQQPFFRTLIIYFIAIFFGNALPTTIGGDVMRVMYGIPERKTESLATVLADRILGFLGLFIFTLGCVLYVLVVHHKMEFLLFATVGLAVLAAATYFLFSEKTYSLFSPPIQKITVLHLGERLSNLHRIMTGFGGAGKLIAGCLGLSIAIQIILSLAPYLVLLSMGRFSTGLLPFFLYIPVINVVSMIPISLSALGVRENAYVIFFARVGLDGAAAFATSLVSFFLFFLCTLAGGICFIFYKRGKIRTTRLNAMEAR